MNDPDSSHLTLPAAYPPSAQPKPRWWAAAPGFCALFAALVAVVVLTGWSVHSQPLVTILPGLPAMAQSTACAFLFAGIALSLKQSESPRRNVYRSGQAFAAFTFLIGSATLLRYAQIFLGHQNLPAGSLEHPINRMSPNSAINFVLLGSALFLTDVRGRGDRWPAQALAFIVLLDALVALIGQLYGVTFLYGLSAFLGMAAPTVVLFLVLSIGLLLARPERGFLSILLADNAAGRVGRRFLPLGLIAPVMLGGVGLLGQRISRIDTPFLAYLLVTGSAGLLGWLIWSNVLALSAEVQRSQSYERQVAELERAQIENTLRASEQRLQFAVESAGIGTWYWNSPFVDLVWSDQCFALFGLTPQVQMTRDDLYEHIHPDDRERTHEAIEKAISDSGVYDIEYRAVWPDGTVHWIAARGRGYKNERGNPSRFEGTMQDIDEKRRAGERQRQFLRDVLASVTEGRLILCDIEADLPLLQSDFGPPIALSMAGGLLELRVAVRNASLELGFSDDRCYDLMTAANEAGMNAIVHVGSGEGTVTVDSRKSTIQVRVTDHGSGIALENLPHATLMKGYSSAGTLGHGMKMILQTADRVYLLTSPSGTTVVLEQNRVARLPELG